jgi:hypothetical protein
VSATLEALAGLGGALEQVEPVRWDSREGWADTLAGVEAEHPDLDALVRVAAPFRWPRSGSDRPETRSDPTTSTGLL